MKASTSHSDAAGTTQTRPPTNEQHDESGGRGSGLLASLRWLRRRLSRLARWVAQRLRAPVRPIARMLLVRWVATHVPAPLRWLGRLLAPGKERDFGFWWLLATLAVALALGMVVALLLTPVAGLIALLVVGVWALVRRRRRKRDDGDNHPSRAPAAVTTSGSILLVAPPRRPRPPRPRVDYTHRRASTPERAVNRHA
jgi:hypothetical protein